MWGEMLWQNLRIIGQSRKSFSLRMLGGSHVGYVRATRKWWEPVDKLFDTLRTPKQAGVLRFQQHPQPRQSHIRLHALNHQDALTKFALSGNDPYLAEECHKLQQGIVPGNWQNFLYYVAREWIRTPEGKLASHNRQ